MKLYQAIIVDSEGRPGIANGLYPDEASARKIFDGPSSIFRMWGKNKNAFGFVRLLTEMPIELETLESGLINIPKFLKAREVSR